MNQKGLRRKIGRKQMKISAAQQVKNEEINYVVYIHTFPNGKKYVGISRNVSRRFRNGKGYAHQPIMRNAIKKFGWDSVKTEIFKAGLTADEAKNLEIELIEKLKTTDRSFGYNQTLGGEGGNGRVESEENKKRIGERMSKLHKGVPLSDEHKKKISETLRGKPKSYSEEGRQRIIESNQTRHYSEQTREKMSQNTKRAMKEKNMSEYLSRKWQEDKEQRKAKLRITMYDRYGIIPKKYDLRDDVIALGLNKEDYSELFKEDEK